VRRGGPSRNIGELLGELEGEDAQLVLSYIVWPGGAPLPSVVDEWVRREAADAKTLDRSGALTGRHPSRTTLHA
jgi:hypothetical protein